MLPVRGSKKPHDDLFDYLKQTNKQTDKQTGIRIAQAGLKLLMTEFITLLLPPLLELEVCATTPVSVALGMEVTLLTELCPQPNVSGL